MNTPHPALLPQLITVGSDARCGCGELLGAGERVGHRATDGRLYCLWCLADVHAGREPVEPVFLAAHAAVDEHTRAVSTHANDLRNRLSAAHALGTLTSALQPLHARHP